MRAIFIVPRFHPCPGGYENYVLWLTRYLRERGDSVKVFTTTAYDLESFWIAGHGTLAPGRENVEGVEVERLPISYERWKRRMGRVLGFLPDWRLQARFARPSFSVHGLASQLKREPAIDVIHIGPLPYNSLMYEGIREARRRGIRVITTPCTHFGEDQRQTVAKHYTRPFQIELLNQCDAVLALTDVERERLIRAGVSPQKVNATGAGIDPDTVTQGDASTFRRNYGINSPLVVQIGTKAFEKGSMTLLDAMQRLWAAGSDASLALVGNSTIEFDNYLSRTQPASPRLLNLGAISDDTKRDLLAAATVLAHPSRVESLGLVYLEAWANNKPVIAADTAVAREVIEAEVDGLLIPFGNADALSGAISRLLADQDLRLGMGTAGRRKVQNRFSWKAAADRIYPFFRNQTREVTTAPHA
jgi:glycogen synthase